MHDELAKKINNIKTADTSNLVTKFSYHTKKLLKMKKMLIMILVMFILPLKNLIG